MKEIVFDEVIYVEDAIKNVLEGRGRIYLVDTVSVMKPPIVLFKLGVSLPGSEYCSDYVLVCGKDIDDLVGVMFGIFSDSCKFLYEES